MSIAVSSKPDASQFARIRVLSAALALAALVDVVWVRAPFLVVTVIPSAIAAWRYRRGRVVSTIALGLWCALYILIGLNFAVTNGLHAPLEAGHARHWINPGDFVFVYVGTPIAAWLGVLLVTRLVRRRTSEPAGAAATA